MAVTKKEEKQEALKALTSKKYHWSALKNIKKIYKNRQFL